MGVPISQEGPHQWEKMLSDNATRTLELSSQRFSKGRRVPAKMLPRNMGRGRRWNQDLPFLLNYSCS